MSFPKNKVLNPPENKTLGTRLHFAKDGHDSSLAISPKFESEPSDQVTCRIGDSSCARAHASTLDRFSSFQPSRKTKAVLSLQRNYRNRFVAKVLHSTKELRRPSRAPDLELLTAQKCGSVQTAGNSAEVTPEVEATIEQTRGGGQPLDSTLQAQMGKAFNADFSAVRVHTNTEAGALNQSLNARAFTTGKDIYFCQGEYRPGTSTGREPLAHELTHVMQQNGDETQTKKKSSEGKKLIFRKVTLGSPGDIYEQEAYHVAAAVSRQEQMPGPTTEEEKEKETVATKQRGDQLLRQEQEYESG